MGDGVGAGGGGGRFPSCSSSFCNSGSVSDVSPVHGGGSVKFPLTTNGSVSPKSATEFNPPNGTELESGVGQFPNKHFTPAENTSLIESKEYRVTSSGISTSSPGTLIAVHGEVTSVASQLR